MSSAAEHKADTVLIGRFLPTDTAFELSVMPECLLRTDETKLKQRGLDNEIVYNHLSSPWVRVL